MRIFLVGYRGSGKSTVGKLVAEKLSLPLYCLDQLLEKEAGQSIPELVAEKGWDYFRDQEERLLSRYAQKKGVLDCGGGVIERTANRAILKREPWVFFLKTEVATLQNRLAFKQDRPALSQDQNFLEEIAQIYTRRIPLYEEVSGFVVDAGRSPEEVAVEILGLIHS
ncbi:MAG: shikimate kinase [Spirochaetae bacterium HGW-Spirochaetae-6]|jgi:shikimate kinase|nr:MAG: shikimate kinase [Spirochaetae bacterium HGW-Spirochaetae-6]